MSAAAIRGIPAGMIRHDSRSTQTLERLSKIVPEIRHRFEPDREAHQAGRDPLARRFLDRQGAVTGRRGMAEGRRDIAKARREGNMPQPADEGVGPRAVAEVDRHDRSETLRE